MTCVAIWIMPWQLLIAFINGHPKQRHRSHSVHHKLLLQQACLWNTSCSRWLAAFNYTSDSLFNHVHRSHFGRTHTESPLHQSHLDQVTWQGEEEAVGFQWERKRRKIKRQKPRLHLAKVRQVGVRNSLNFFPPFFYSLLTDRLIGCNSQTSFSRFRGEIKPPCPGCTSILDERERERETKARAEVKEVVKKKKREKKKKKMKKEKRKARMECILPNLLLIKDKIASIYQLMTGQGDQWTAGRKSSPVTFLDSCVSVDCFSSPVLSLSLPLSL